MSKMMDNLARVREEEETSQKPSLFLVRDQAPPSALAPALSGIRPRAAIVWGIVGVAVLALAFIFVRSLPEPSKTVVVTVSAPAANEGIVLIRAKDFINAKAKLDQLLAASPGNRAHLINRAYVLKELGKMDAAESEYKTVLATSPTDAIVLNNLGALYLSMNRLGEAETLLIKAAESGSTEARLNMAALREKEKNWEGARRIFEEMLAAENPGPHRAQIRERVRRLRSLAASTSSPKERL